MSKKKPDIKQLKYPVWFNILFYVLTVLGPMTLLVVQGLRSPSPVFKVTFSVISILLLTWIFIRKFILKNIETRLITEKASLEHDYKIDSGSKKKCKWLWYNNELLLTVFNLIQCAIIVGLIALICIGIQNAAITVKGSIYAVVVFYILAYVTKIVLILSLRGSDETIK